MPTVHQLRPDRLMFRLNAARYPGTYASARRMGPALLGALLAVLGALPVTAQQEAVIGI
jgi:hypothetical protein